MSHGIKIQVDSLVNKDNTGPVDTDGISIGTDKDLDVQCDIINTIGISTLPSLVATRDAVIPTVTSHEPLTGDGSSLTGITSESKSKSIALGYILSDPPLRA